MRSRPLAVEPPILFDEWQVERAIWNRVRRQVDDRTEKGQFILTGSARPRDDANRHSGAGRFSVMQMRPMSLFESGYSTGQISLGALLEGEAQTGLGTHLSFEELLRRIVTGGWPELIGAEEDFARDWLADYLRQVVEVDIPGMGHRRNPGDLRRLLESLARDVGQAVKLSELATEMTGATLGLSPTKASRDISMHSRGSDSPTTQQHGDHTCSHGPDCARAHSPPASTSRRSSSVTCAPTHSCTVARSTPGATRTATRSMPL